MSIKRYDFATDLSECNCGICKDQDGPWVTHTDHIAALAAKDAEIERWRRVEVLLRDKEAAVACNPIVRECLRIIDENRTEQHGDG